MFEFISACNCHPKGSISPSCRLEDGQCNCLSTYEGVRCDRCISGRGNTEAGCPPCQCDPIGTRPEYLTSCDPVSGQCSCKPGVGGTLDCSTCQVGYYNLGPNGCTGNKSKIYLVYFFFIFFVSKTSLEFMSKRFK